MREHTHGTDTALKFELARLREKNEIRSLRRGFYLIIPPRYTQQGQPPLQLYVDKLFKYLERTYYLGTYTAAKFHGAGHQQAQRDYITIETPKLNQIQKKGIDIQFFTTSTWPEKNLLNKKSDAGIYKISSPALTAVDLINHQTKLGGLNRMLAIIEELSEEITESDISDLLSWYPHTSTLQRFGFLLTQFGAPESLSALLLNFLQQSQFYPVLLSPRSNQKPGAVANSWKVDINIQLNSDL